jgi:hypothetical protein
LVVVLLLTFSGGVVIETFERHAVSIQKQEKLVGKYNSYSGTVTAAIERPLELFMALVIHVAVLRLVANDVLDSEKQCRIRVLVVALSASATYLLANGLSAVNVQTREQPVPLAITTKDLAVQTPDLTTTSTVDKSFAENRSGNPVTNTILRNLLLPQAIETEQACSDPHTMRGEDEVLYRITPQAWQRHLLPTALEPRSMQFEVAASNTAANMALTTDQFPMNASLAAELLLYSSMDPSEGNAWVTKSGLFIGSSPKSFISSTIKVYLWHHTPLLTCQQRGVRHYCLRHSQRPSARTESGSSSTPARRCTTTPSQATRTLRFGVGT